VPFNGRCLRCYGECLLLDRLTAAASDDHNDDATDNRNDDVSHSDNSADVVVGFASHGRYHGALSSIGRRQRQVCGHSSRAALLLTSNRAARVHDRRHPAAVRVGPRRRVRDSDLDRLPSASNKDASQRSSDYAEICGRTLARAHGRSGDAVTIGAYLGSGDALDTALADFAELYADQNELDYAALDAAVKSRRVKAETGL
jgi:Uncharacterized protein conserved in bacteria (DUF2252)